jgi:hypothetical protein
MTLMMPMLLWKLRFRESIPPCADCLFFPWNNGFVNILAHEKCDDRAQRHLAAHLCSMAFQQLAYPWKPLDRIGATGKAAFAG